MKEFENKIYRRLLAPVLACLVLALAGCSQDATEAEAPSSPTGGTYLTIVTRGIVTGTEDQGNYEDYVGSLRVMAFDNEGNRVINELVTDLPQEDDTDSYVTITEELPAGTITSGVYTFYFVANEDGYNTTTADETLADALAEVSNTTNLEAIQVKTEMTADGQVKPTATNMLMSTGPYTALIREGENNRIGDDNHIKLVRAFAKAQLALKLPKGSTSQDVPTVTDVKLNGTYPASFYLIPGNTEKITPSVALSDRAIEGGGTLFDKSQSITPAPFYISQTVYLPECSYDASNAWAYHITIDEQTYTNAVIADRENPDEIDYDITRNYAYTTIGTYNPLTEVPLTFNVVVVPWVEKEITVPPFE